MEFPDDVLAIIREYSRPKMRYIREYNIALRALNITEWKGVQEKLKTDEADEVIKAVDAYAMSVVELRYMQAQEVILLDTFKSEEVTLDMFHRVQAQWKDLILIQKAIRKKNKICNDRSVVLGKLLMGDVIYSRRWIRVYEEQEENLENEHCFTEERYNMMEEAYREMENAYGWVRLLYDN
jgi:hypothetical protein